MTDLQSRLLNRFLRYTAIPSQSDPGAGEVPSSPGQRRLAQLLAAELRELGLCDVAVSDHAVVTAHLPANRAGVPKVGWVAHLDTVDVHLHPEIHPVLIRDYDGGDICQNPERDIWLRASEHPELLQYKGQDILVSDGTSVLGADNKAAVANIMTALEQLQTHPEMPHGDIYVAFVPDEEIGLLGAKAMDLSRFPVDFAYTIDCCALGEVVWETFNAGTAVLSIQGVTAHPMSAKGVLVNPALIAVDFVNLLDRSQTPECTEGREGFLWVSGMEADSRNARVTVTIRDHDLEKYRQKKAYLHACTEELRARYLRAELNLQIADVYGNIADAIPADDRRCIDLLYRTLENLGIAARTIPMRGGTDGSYLSVCGIPTPNYFTGAHNFHSPAEFLPMDSFEQSLQVTLGLIAKIAG